MTKEGPRLSRIGLCGYLHGFPARPLWCSSDSYSTTESSSILKTDDPTLVSLWFFAFLTILHFSTWFLILPYILVPWLPSCFLHPRGLSSPAYVLCWCPFFCSSFLRAPFFSPHIPSFFSSSPPYFLLVHPLRPLSLLAHHIRHPSLILDADHPSPNVLLISDTWSTISPDIWHRPPPVFLLRAFHLLLTYNPDLIQTCQICSSYNLIWGPYHWQDHRFFTKLSILGILIAPKSFDATLGAELQSFRVSQFQSSISTCNDLTIFFLNNFTPTLSLASFSKKFMKQCQFFFLFSNQ